LSRVTNKQNKNKQPKENIMKKQTTSIAIASIFAVTSIFVAAAVQISDQELGIGEYSEQASHNVPALDDKELGIGEYGEQA